MDLLADVDSTPPARSTDVPADPYPVEDLELDLRWWAAANYLTVGQIYLQDDALLARPLTRTATSSPGCSATGAPAPACRRSTSSSTG